jgi:ACT domain-containing protein
VVRCEKCGEKIGEDPVIRVKANELKAKEIKWLGKTIQIEDNVLTVDLCRSCFTKFKLWLEIEEKEVI